MVRNRSTRTTMKRTRTSRKPRKRRASSIKVNKTENYWDRQVEALAQKGLTIETIAKQTGLSRAQVYYRVQKFGTSTMSYRRGENVVAKKAIAEVNGMLNQIQGLNKLPRSRRVSSKTQAA